MESLLLPDWLTLKCNGGPRPKRLATPKRVTFASQHPLTVPRTMSEQTDVENLQMPDRSFDNSPQGPSTQGNFTQRQPSADRAATGATNINAVAEIFMNPSFQAQINTLQNGNGSNNNGEVDNGLRQVFFGLS